MPLIMGPVVFSPWLPLLEGARNMTEYQRSYKRTKHGNQRSRSPPEYIFRCKNHKKEKSLPTVILREIVQRRIVVLENEYH